MKRKILTFLLLGFAMAAFPETVINVIGNNPDDKDEKERPERSCGIIPAVWYSDGEIFVRVAIRPQTVVMQLSDDFGVVAASVVSTDGSGTARFDASMLEPGEEYSIELTIASRQWKGSFVAD